MSRAGRPAEASRWAAAAVCALAVCALALGCSRRAALATSTQGRGAQGAEGEEERGAIVAESRRAQGIVDALRGLFVIEDRGAPLPGPAAAPRGVPALRSGVVRRFERISGDRVRAEAEPGVGGAIRRATVELPARASGWVRVEEEDTGFHVSFAIQGARGAELEVASGIAVYPDAAGDGAHLLHRARADGTEDFFVFERAPPEEAITYEVDVTDVAGLRLVGNTLELLDEAGTPRLRVAPPYIVSAPATPGSSSSAEAEGQPGRAREGALRVLGCEVDTSSIPPWGRPVTPPCPAPRGSCQCEVQITWSGLGVTYPMLLDPAWTTTKSMAEPRRSATASVLPNGWVLVAGGEGIFFEIASTEIFNPAQGGSWSPGAPLAEPRRFHTATTLPDGRILVTAGRGYKHHLASAEVFDPATMQWQGAGSMLSARSHHAAALFTVGGAARVLVTGGEDEDTHDLKTAEIYDVATGLWSPAASMSHARSHHTASPLPGAEVLVVGGGDEADTCERYRPIDDAWSEVDEMLDGREEHVAIPLNDGRVAVMGGRGDADDVTEIFDPTSKLWSLAPRPPTRPLHSAVILPNGQVLVVGGSTDRPATAELFDPGELLWSSAGALSGPRVDPIAALTGNTLVVAGGYSGVEMLGTAEVLTFLPDGSACEEKADCLSGFCVDHVCCGDRCDRDCLACRAADTGLASDGLCGKRLAEPCGVYACDVDDNCPSACADSAMCAAGYSCVDGECLSDDAFVCDGGVPISLTGEVKSCGDYRCSTANECFDRCETTAQCAFDKMCSENKCVDTPALPPATSSTYCAARQAPPPGYPPGALVFLVMGAGLGVRACVRRRARPAPPATRLGRSSREVT